MRINRRLKSINIKNRGWRTIKSNSSFIIRSAAWMTALSLLNKTAGVFLRLYTSARIGSEGMGLYQLILSVYSMFSTFATAGFTVSVSRMVAEKGERSEGDARLVMSNAFVASALVSAAATLLMLVFSNKIAEIFLGDIRAGAPLRILALSMPFMAAAACLKGWFIAKRKAVITSSASLFEQAVKFAVILLFLGIFFADVNDPRRLCTGIVIGVTVSEMSSCAFLFLFRFVGERRAKSVFLPTETRADNRRELIKVTVPISLSVYVTSIIHTVETMLVPFAFEKFSGDRSYALSQFGVIRGMVIPVLFFPFAFLGSLVSVFTPEISRLNMLEDKTLRNERIKKVMSFVSVFSIAAGGLFFALPEQIGSAFYPGENTAGAIRLLAAVTPFMYIETVCDGILKAIGEQNKTLKYTVLNSALRVVLILTLVSSSGGEGYLRLLVISNTFSYLLCRARLAKVTGARPKLISGVFIPLLCAASGGFCAVKALEFFIPSGAPAAAAAAVGSGVYVAAFAAPLMVFSGKSIVGSLRRESRTEESAAG